MIFYQLFKRYEIEITHIFYGLCFAFLGYFMVTVPVPVGSATGLLCALLLNEPLNHLNYDDYFPQRFVGWIAGLFIFSLLSPPLIHVQSKAMIVGSVLGGIATGLSIVKELDKDFRVLLILLFSCFPIFTMTSLFSYIMLGSISAWTWLISFSLYFLFFGITNFFVEKRLTQNE